MPAEMIDRIQGTILIVGMLCLAAIVLCVVAKEFTDAIYRWFHGKHTVILSIAGIIGIYVGGTKVPRPMITWDAGIHDNGSEISTNDTRMIAVRWTYENWVPPVATFTLRAIPKTPNPDPSADMTFVVASVPITNMVLYAMMEMDATNYFYFAEQSFIPEAPVVTNGVYHIKCFGGNNVWVPHGLKIYGDGNCILPPEPPEGENYLIDIIQGDRQ